MSRVITITGDQPVSWDPGHRPGLVVGYTRSGCNDVLVDFEFESRALSRSVQTGAGGAVEVAAGGPCLSGTPRVRVVNVVESKEG
jgi:hypothetical protein